MKKIMKKTIFRTLLFSVMMFFSFVSFGQVENGDYSEYDANTTVPTNIDYATVNSTVGYFVKPDAYYHPDYTAVGTWVLTANFTWNWTIPTNPGAASISSQTDNYVEITYPATGNYVINVAEQAPASMGSCADATPTVMNITVLPLPTAEITGANVGVMNVTTADHEFYACGNQAAENITITITETGVPAGLASYAYFVQKRVINIDNSDTEIPASQVITTLVDYPTTGKNATATADGGTEVLSTGLLDVLNNERTKYEFTLLQPSDLSTTEGIVSAVSHKSDYVSLPTITTHPFTGTVTVVYIVNPAPQTEQIYHIPTSSFI